MVLDINAGVVYNSNPNPNETEPPLMRQVLRTVMALTDTPLCIDSSAPGALEASLEEADGRSLLSFAVTKKIVERAADFGIPAADIVVDPLVMPVGAMASAGQQVFALVRRLRTEPGVNTTCGAWIGFSRMIEAVKEGVRVAEASRAAAPPTRRAEA